MIVVDKFMFVGGYATRVAELCSRYGCEKHELPVDNHPLYAYNERRHGKINYITSKGLGTAGNIRYMDSMITRFPYMILYGDMYVDMDYNILLGKYIEYSADLLILSMETEDVDYGKLEIDSGSTYVTDKVTNFKRIHNTTRPYLTNVGVYLVGERMHNVVIHSSGASLESDIMESSNILGTYRNLFELLNIVHYRVDSRYVYDVGTPRRYEDTCSRLRW